jgi:hypothetical protein
MAWPIATALLGAALFDTALALGPASAAIAG